MKKRLLVIGNSYMNFVSKVRRAPERLETVISNSDFSVVPGGFGLLSVISAAKLDLDSILCSRVGDDENGEKIKKAASSFGIDTRFLMTDKRKPTGTLSITEEENYKKRVIVYPGANISISFDDIEAAFTSYPDMVLIGTDLRQDLVLDAVKLSNSSNIPVAFSADNPVGEFEYLDLGEIEIFSVNQNQAFKISGINPIDANSALHASIKISNSIKCKYVVIRLGERGTFVYDGVYSQILPALPIHYIDANGVENVFTSALASAYLDFNDINKAATFANTAASFYASKEGEYCAIPNLEDIKKLFDNF